MFGTKQNHQNLFPWTFSLLNLVVTNKKSFKYYFSALLIKLLFPSKGSLTQITSKNTSKEVSHSLFLT